MAKPATRKRAAPSASPQAEFAGFLAKYTPAMVKDSRAALTRLRRQVPGAVELVYDNYNALAIGFGPSERASEAIFSIALYPRWVTLFFLRGKGLPDPHRLLQGNGKIVRSIVLEDDATLDRPAVRALMARALERAVKPIDRKGESRIVIRAVSAKQRARRPT